MRTLERSECWLLPSLLSSPNVQRLLEALWASKSIQALKPIQNCHGIKYLRRPMLNSEKHELALGSGEGPARSELLNPRQRLLPLAVPVHGGSNQGRDSYPWDRGQSARALQSPDGVSRAARA